MWYRNVVHGELRCVTVFWVMAGKECCCGFCWGYFESVGRRTSCEVCQGRVGVAELRCLRLGECM